MLVLAYVVLRVTDSVLACAAGKAGRQFFWPYGVFLATFLSSSFVTLVAVLDRLIALRYPIYYRCILDHSEKVKRRNLRFQRDIGSPFCEYRYKLE